MPQLRRSCMVFFQSIVPPSWTMGKMWVSLLPSLSWTCVERILSFMGWKAAFDAFGHVGVAGVEDEVELEVSSSSNWRRRSAVESSLGIFSSRISDAALAGEDAELFEGGECGVDLMHAELFVGPAHVLDQVLEGNRLGDFEGALDLVEDSMRRALTVSVMVTTACGPERPQISSLYMGEWRDQSFSSESRNQWPSSATCALF